MSTTNITGPARSITIASAESARAASAAARVDTGTGRACGSHARIAATEVNASSPRRPERLIVDTVAMCDDFSPAPSSAISSSTATTGTSSRDEDSARRTSAAAPEPSWYAVKAAVTRGSGDPSSEEKAAEAGDAVTTRAYAPATIALVASSSGDRTIPRVETSVDAAPVGRLVDSRYRIDATVARGGMATVYLAFDTRLERPVALKIMHPELAADDDFVSRFIGEARSAARLSDPHVVSVYDQGEDDGAVYLAMEFIDGQTLREVLREQGRLSADIALEIIESVLAALAAAHANGIVHRDVKPENVLLGNDGRVTVADFGLARAVADHSNATRGLLLGTVSYVSPEQALGETATARSDVYSTGILLYELLTGQVPHDGPTDFVVVRKHIDEDVPPVSRLVRVAPEVEDLVRVATSRDPADRYADASRFLSAARRAHIAQREFDPEETGFHSTVGDPREAAGVGLREAFDDATVRHDAVAPPPVPPPPSIWVEEDGGEPTRYIDARELQADLYDEVDDPTVVAAHDARPPGRRGKRSADPERTWIGRVLVALVVVLAIVVGVAGWWFGSGRWTTTPSLTNLDVAAATAAAEEAGLSLTQVGEEYSETVEAGVLISTDPPAGDRILKNGAIGYVVSLGPERLEVPDVVEQPESAATDALLAEGLEPAVETEYHDTVPEGQVIRQVPEAGEQVKRDSTVTIVVSQGREPIEIVDYTGQPADEAQQALEEAGFAVRREEAPSNDVAPGSVIRQSPDDGNGYKGDEIFLEVSSGPDLVEYPDVRMQKVDDAVKILESLGYEVTVTGRGGPFNPDKRVYSQDPAPTGEGLPSGSHITLDLTPAITVPFGSNMR